MVKALFCGAAVLVATIAPAQTKYRVLQGEREVGHARYTQRLTEQGEKVTELIVYLKVREVHTTVRRTSTFNIKGEPIRSLMDVKCDSPKSHTQVIDEFKADGVHEVTDRDGQRSTQTLPLPKSGRYANAAEFWFIRDLPKTGDKVSCFTLDASTFAWKLTETTYEGKGPKGHRVKVDMEGRVITGVYDEKGNPIETEDSDGFRLVRFF